MLFTKNKNLWNEKKDFLYIWLLQRIKEKKIENRTLDIFAFTDTHVCLNNPFSKISRITVFLSKFYIVISGTLIGSSMCFPCCSLCNIRAPQERTPNLRKKVYIRKMTFRFKLNIYMFFIKFPKFSLAF